MQRNAISAAIAAAIALVSTSAWADAASDERRGEAGSRKLDEVVVQGEISYRDRTGDIAPVLAYDLAYFQRFEPLTVGDMLKRVPSVAFVSDVLEFDGVRLRGLDPGYTQILINGEKVPGAGPDRSFFVDRIPAELVERIEIVRSPSANRSGDAVAGAVNIVLRDAYEFDGAYLRAGGLNFSDGENEGTFGGVAAGEVGGGRLLGGFNVQGRHNPKDKRSDRFEEPDGDFVDREDQDDVRDGIDYSANVSWTRDVGGGTFALDALYVLTDREERERSLEYNDPESEARDNLLSITDQLEDIDQTTFTIRGGYEFEALGGRNELRLGHARFDEDTRGTEESDSFDDDDTPPSFDEREGTRELLDIDDREDSFEISHERQLGGAMMELGVDFLDKDRETVLRTSEVDTDEEGAPLPPYDDFDRVPARIEERRIDPYVQFEGRGTGFAWNAGVRYEDTDAEIGTEDGEEGNDYGFVLPSAHLRWDLGEADRVNLSAARTLRRPDFASLLPIKLEGELGDNDFVGNPQLDPESAWGIDLGWEHRIGRDGVIGVNVFWRDVSDLIEVVNTGEPSEAAVEDFEEELEEYLDENPGAQPGDPGYPEFDPDSFVYSAANVGDGTAWGVELDLSMPLTAFGLDDTGVFLNYSWLDSDVDDEFGSRRFNNQARYVLNAGFIQDLPEWGGAFGLSYRKQGDAFSRVIGEEVRTSYDGDLEAFVEKRFGDNLALRLTASNLLDASKDELFDKFDNLEDQIDRDYDEFERETEASGRVVQLVARYSF